MDYFESIKRVIDCVGEYVTIRILQQDYSVKAVVQPMRYKNKLYLEMDSTALGLNDAECFLYLGSSEVDFAGVEMETVIYTNDRAFNVSRVDRVCFGGKTLYIWAVLTPRTRGGKYDSQ